MSAPPRKRPKKKAAAKPVRGVGVRELRALRNELTSAVRPARVNADARDVQRSVARLVLALVEFLRRLLEKQVLRRMEAGTLSPGEIEDLGLALLKLEETVRELAQRFDLAEDELNLDLGPLGKLI